MHGKGVYVWSDGTIYEVYNNSFCLFQQVLKNAQDLVVKKSPRKKRLMYFMPFESKKDIVNDLNTITKHISILSLLFSDCQY